MDLIELVNALTNKLNYLLILNLPLAWKKLSVLRHI